MQPRRHTIQISCNGSVTTETASVGCRSVSTGDVRRSSGSIDGQTSTSTLTSLTTQLPQSPTSPSSSVSSPLPDDNEHSVTSTLDVFQSTLTQLFSVDSRRGNNDSNSQSSSVVELRRHSEPTDVTSTVATTTVCHQTSKLASSSSGVSTPAGKPHPPRPPVKPRRTSSLGDSKERPSEDLSHETRTTAVSDTVGTDVVRRLPAVPHSTGEIKGRRDHAAVDERQTAQHSTVSDSSIHVQTTTSVSVSTTTTSSTDVSCSSGRLLPVPPLSLIHI